MTSSPAMSSFIEQLISTLGPDLVTLGGDVPAGYDTDWSGWPPVQPMALVRPRTTNEVSRTLALCHAHRVPVTPQGGRTGLAGGAVPSAGAIALSLERMDHVEEVDAAAATLSAQAGATLEAVRYAASEAGMVFGVDLGARGSCQIGGNVSTNAGGNGVVQYGMMREQVLGLEVVLADGTVLPMMRPMIKNNTGYDLKQCFIGAEGTLGIITRVLLRLHPAPAATATALIALSGFDAALALLGEFRRAFPGGLAAFEAMWADFFDASLSWQHLSSPFSQRYPLYVLADVTGHDDPVLQDTLQKVLEPAFEKGTALDATIAQSNTQARALWKIREATAELPSNMSPPINFDISIPTRRIGEFGDAVITELTRCWPGHQTVRFGHVGDGNLHVSTDASTVSGDEMGVERVVYALVERFGGSISAEHGIGLHKKPYLSASRTPQEIDAMRALKLALDPLNLMNPGKLF